jgi:hypothetical protein
MSRLMPWGIVLAALLLGIRAEAVTVYAVVEAGDDYRLLSFDSATPGTIDVDEPITGTAPNTLTALDFRPATGELYGLAVDGGITNAFLYRVDPATGQATAIGNAIPLPQAAGVMAPGTRFGFDFDPVADLIRVTSNTGDNYRLDPDSGAVVMADTQLSTEAIGGIAYNNNVAGAAQSTLFGIDVFNNTLVRIGGVNGVPSPSGGQVTSIGSYGFDDQDNDGFDIAPDGQALAVLVQMNLHGLYSIDLASGAATPLGSVADGTVNVLAMAIFLGPVIATAAPAPTLSFVALAAALLALAGVALARLRRSGSG